MSICRLPAFMTFAVAFAAAWLLLPTPVRADKWDKRVGALPPEIEFVLATGYWSDKDREGNFRVLITQHGYEHVDSRLYLQWLAHDVDTRTSRVAANVPVKELNEPLRFHLQVQVKGQEINQLKLSVIATNSRTEQVKAFTIEVTGFGKYKLTQKKN